MVAQHGRQPAAGLVVPDGRDQDDLGAVASGEEGRAPRISVPVSAGVYPSAVFAVGIVQATPMNGDTVSSVAGTR